MDWHQSRLPNGLRILTVQRPGSRLVAVRVCVRAGSRYDNGGSGTAHLLEHWLLSGTQHRSALEVHDAIDSLGGEINAQTGKEYIAFHCVTPAAHWLTGLDVLTDVLIYPLLDEQALTHEKSVVLDEIRHFQDRSRIIFSLFAQTLWQKHPLRHLILGHPEKVLSLERETLVRVYQRHFTTGNTVVAVCGALSHDQVCDQVGQKLAHLPQGGECLPSSVAEPPLTQPRLAHLTRETKQTYLMLGVPTVSMKHPDRSALKVIERVLGMGMGARLHWRLRNELGLVYGVATAAANYEDAGYLSAFTTCHPQKVSSVREAIVEELAALCRHGVTVEELSKAQANYAGTLARRFETNLSIASIAAIEGLLHRVEPFPDSIARIQAVTLDDVRRVAAHYLNTEGYVMVTVGSDNADITKTL